MPGNHFGLFLAEFIRNPVRTAAFAPSSATLAARMLARLSASDTVIVELGPGTGAFTEAIQRAIQHTTRQTVPRAAPRTHIAIELNERLATGLAERYPGVDVINANATSLPEVLGPRRADFVVSGLPWAAYAGPQGEKLIDTVAGLLNPGGTFTQFAYAWSRWAPPARRQLRQLRAAFAEVELSEIVWANLPPAVVYTASTPRRAAPREDTER